MELTINGVNITVPNASIEQIVRERLLSGSTPSDLPERPEIGAAYQGGIYAGVTIEAEKPHALVLLPEEAEAVTFEDARKWAAERGGTLPSRIDLLVLLSNLKSEFKSQYYWSSTQHASCSRYAWCQGFDDGYQDYFNVDSPLRARAVRRIELSHSVI